MCPILSMFMSMFVYVYVFVSLAVLQENNVKACLPLTYTAEEYNIEDIR